MKRTTKSSRVRGGAGGGDYLITYPSFFKYFRGANEKDNVHIHNEICKEINIKMRKISLQYTNYTKYNISHVRPERSV